jgi:hypothetical protein
MIRPWRKIVVALGAVAVLGCGHTNVAAVSNAPASDISAGDWPS